MRRSLGALAREDPLTSALAGVALAALGWWLAHMAATGVRGAAGAAGLVALPAWIAHAARDDLRTLAVSGAHATRVTTLEYLALHAPGTLIIAGAALLGNAPLAPLAALCGTLPIASALLAARSRVGTLRRVGHVAARTRGRDHLGHRFELRRGLRGDRVGLAFIVVLALALSSIPVVPALAIVALALSVAYWYGAVDEDWPLVVALGRAPAPFLRAKLASALGAWGLASAPLVVASLVRVPEAWLAPTLACAIGATVVASGVLLKYARYAPGRRAPAVVLVGAAVAGASLAVPPLAAWLLATWWRAARGTLAPYIGEGAP